ncbi:uncharacterized protein [Cicer arietinum]|uniref:Uncharacterized protein LOC101506643 n=1 Tax=Cicer arietinum TaxID=3827 RepID=A0A1S2Y9T2_CICAR|nr:uncharacterized protein LOC101506643 [Cicer arietinum]
MTIDLNIDDTLAKRYCNNKSNKPLTLYSEARYLIIRLPNSRFTNTCYRLLLLILALVSFQFIIRSFLINAQRISSSDDSINANSIYTEQRVLSILFRDLTNEGLLKQTQHKAVFLTNDASFKVITDYNDEMEVVPLNDIEKQNSQNDNTVDFIFTSNFPSASRFIERVLKPEGIVTVLINDNNPTTSFYKPENYKIVYMRRFDSIAVAMKKTANSVVTTVDKKLNIAAPRKLFSYASEAKKNALKNLEDVLLEPPRAASGKSRIYLKRTKYLPDLMGDSLESYSRRVFIDVALPEKEGESGTEWFVKNYPTRNKKFEMYKIETVMEESSGRENGISDWLNKNVKDEEYVVMKAEAEVVEEMMRSNSIGLVDELFLECKPRGQMENKNRRAYWECLALYGKLRDEGVAVHQWWG